MNLASIIVLLIIGAGVYWSINTLRRTGGRRCGGCGGCCGGSCETHHEHAGSKGSCETHHEHAGSKGKSGATDDSCPCCHKK